MLINFALENWKSFKEPARLSLVEGKCPRKGREIPKIKHYNSGVLPLASIYGGNASGKSNFVEAIEFAQNLIVNGTDSDGKINSEPFLLDNSSENQPSKFEFTLLIDEIIYNYSFSVTQSTVINETLYKYSEDKTPIIQFERNGQEFKFGREFDKKILRNVTKTTRKGQLMLRNATYLDINYFSSINDWFKNALQVISPSSEFITIHKLLDSESSLAKRVNKTLFSLDTGIIGLSKNEFELPSDLVDSLISRKVISKDDLNQSSHTVEFSPGEVKFSLNIKDGKVVASSLVTQHRKPTGEIVDFDIRKESEGTKRLIDLIPALFDLTQNSTSSVLVIDELDRSLHSYLTKNLIESYLKTCNQNSRTQLIFTTHDLSLISSLPICNDEICVTDRDIDGITRIISIGDFKEIKKDDDILKLYQKGLVGGIPNILFENTVKKPFDKVVLEED